MRGALVTLAVGAAAAAAFFGLGFGLQVVGLRPASHASRVGANAAGQLLRHRVMASTFSIDGGPQETGTCLLHWFRRSTGALRRGTLLELGSGGRVVSNGGPVAFERLERPHYLPRLLLMVAGCTRELGQRVALAAQVDTVAPRRTMFDGRPALELRLARIHDPITKTRSVVDRVELWVDPVTYAPLAVHARVGRHEGFGRLRLEPMTAALLRRLLEPA